MIVRKRAIKKFVRIEIQVCRKVLKAHVTLNKNKFSIRIHKNKVKDNSNDDEDNDASLLEIY